MLPIYYLPARKSAPPEVLRAAGLGYLVENGSGPSWVEIPHSGPDGKGGCAFARQASGSGDDLSLSPLVGAVKVWKQLPGSPAWLGWDPADPPGPADLARPAQHAGHLVRLGDGREWQVPVARAIGGITAFPSTLAWDGAHWARGDVVPEFADLFGAACRVWDALNALADEAADDGRAVTLDDEAGAAAAALAVNYRIGPGEITLLKLLPDSALIEVLKALVDWPALQAFKKKTARRAFILAWRRGLMPDHRPSVAELAAAAEGENDG